MSKILLNLKRLKKNSSFELSKSYSNYLVDLEFESEFLSFE